MKKYKFLVKPLFFIFNLLLATWLVLKIEKLSPSDFGRHKTLFERTEPVQQNFPHYDKYYIKALADQYRSGKLDSATFVILLEKFIKDASGDQTKTEKKGN
jgi:hypothetical protein